MSRETDNISQLPKSNYQYTRRSFLLFAAGVAAAITRGSVTEASSPPTAIPIWDPTAPTFIQECTSAHVKGAPDVSIMNTKVIGKYICFPDQRQGYTEVTQGQHDNQFTQLMITDQQMNKQFIGNTVTYEVNSQPDQIILMDKSYPDYSTTPDNRVPDLEKAELEILRKLNPLGYDGKIFYQYACMLMPDKDKVSQSPALYGFYGGLGGLASNPYGFAHFIRDELDWLTENKDTQAGSIYVHELGHGLGLDHNIRDLRSVMYPNNIATESLIYDQSDIAGLCDRPKNNMYRQYLPAVFVSK